MPDADRLLRREEVEEQTGLSRSAIYRLMRAGEFPTPIRIGPRAVRWPKAELDEFLAQCPPRHGGSRMTKRRRLCRQRSVMTAHPWLERCQGEAASMTGRVIDLATACRRGPRSSQSGAPSACRTSAARQERAGSSVMLEKLDGAEKGPPGRPKATSNASTAPPPLPGAPSPQDEAV